MGADKALLDWQGVPLAVHVARRLRAVCARVALVGGEGRGYERLGMPWWPDPPGLAGMGPLAGILAALLGCAGRGVVVAACDLPGLDPWIVGRLIAAAGGAPVALAELDGRSPLLAVVRPPAARAARASLSAGSGRFLDLLATPGGRLIPAACLGTAEELRACFANLNSPSDLT
jgi:molybdopterin-guanine dinucleotide biosynthesis protein A